MKEFCSIETPEWTISSSISVENQSFVSLPSDVWDSDSSLQNTVDLGLVEQLRVSRLKIISIKMILYKRTRYPIAFQLNGHLLAVRHVYRYIDISERARTDFPNQFVFCGNDKVLNWHNTCHTCSCCAENMNFLTKFKQMTKKIGQVPFLLFFHK